jgi:hypothetical protein
MKVIAATDKMIVIDLENEPYTFTELTGGQISFPELLRIYPDRIEIMTKEANTQKKRSILRKKKRTIWISDGLIMNDALHRISHPIH